MRTKTIARWRRAALAGTLAATLALPATALAQQPAAQDQAQPAAQDQQAQPAAQDQQAQPAAQEQQAQPAAQDQQAQPAAQDQQAQPAAQEQAQPAAKPKQRPENAPVITEQSPRPPPDTDIHPVPGAPEEYTIVKGDTLWDLSQKFLNNPWYWPKIWSLNPSIENPHWIYPGNKLRIVPGEGGAQAPAQVAEPQAGVDATAANAPPEEPQEEQPITSDAAVSVTPPGTPDLDVISKNSREGRSSSTSVSVSGKLAFSPPPVLAVRASGLVSPEEMAGAGTLDASFEEKEMLATYDTAYVGFKGEVPVRPGDKMLIFRTEGAIRNPITGRYLGNQTKTVGVVKVLSIQGAQATVQVERTFEEIARGDLVRPWTPQDKRVTPKPNTAEVGGVIVRALNSGLTTFGEANEVFIDKGSADGVQEGNTFAVVRRGDGLSNAMVTEALVSGAAGERARSIKTPDENVGLLLVVDTKEHLSTAVVVKSVRELQPGDEVEMHPAGAGGGAP